MKGNIRLVLRLIMHLVLNLVVFGLIISIWLMVLTEVVLPQEGDKQDVVILLGMSVIFVCFIVIFGWYLGKPLFYIISWINRLAGGNYTEPERNRKIYSGKEKKLKRPYRLYKELFVHLRTLSEVLENSRLERSRLDEMRKDWIAGISHDLKTPLTYIKGYSSMLLSPQYEWSTAEKTKFLTEIEEKANHMQDLIGDLNVSFQLDGQQLPLNLKPTDLNEFVRRIVVDVANDPRAAQYNLAFETANAHIVMPLDTALLSRALNNLMLNAILHNPAGTHVMIRIQQQSSYLHIVIEDDGVGMDKDAIDLLFNRYYRGTTTDTRSEGTGLGMAIAKQLVLAHGGDIQVTSRVNEGTSVTVVLPLHN